MVASVLDTSLIMQINCTQRIYTLLSRQGPVPKLQQLADNYSGFCQHYISPLVWDDIPLDKHYRIYQCDSWLFLLHLVGSTQLFVMNLFNDSDQWKLFTLPHYATWSSSSASAKLSYNLCVQEGMILFMISPTRPSLYFTLDDCFFLDVTSHIAVHTQYITDTMQDIICVMNMSTNKPSSANELWFLMGV